MATFNVTNGNDYGAGSLRHAIFQANELSGTDTILLETDVNLNSCLEITDSLYIGTPYGATIEQLGRDRIFTIDDRNAYKNINVSIHRLNLVGGNSRNLGGAIYSSENLEISDTSIIGSQAEHHGGGIYHRTGSLDVIRATVNNNQIMSDDPMLSWGGGIYLDNAESFTFVNGSISENQSIIGSGLAIRNTDSDIYNTTINNDFDDGGIIDISDSSLIMANTTLLGNAQSANYNIINDRNSEFTFDEVAIETSFSNRDFMAFLQ